MKRRVYLGLVLGGAILLAALTFRIWAKSGVVAALVAPAAEDEDGARKPAVLQPAQVIYDGSLAPGWDDWGWGSHELGGGPAKVVFQGYGGILLHHAELESSFGGLAFRYKAPPAFGDFLQVSLNAAGQADDTFPVVAVRQHHVAPLEDGWAEVLVDWKELNPKQQRFDRVLIASRTMVERDPVLLDKVMLTKPTGAAAEAGGSGGQGLRVRCDRDSRPISELIYGGSRDNWDSGQSAKRMGGNPLTRANWDKGVWNVGKDWFFENQGQRTTIFGEIEVSAAQRRPIAVVVPMIGWIAKDATSVSFPRERFPAQAAFDPHRPEAGNGIAGDGKLLTPGAPTTTSVEAPPELIGAWVRKLVAADKARGSRGVHIYILDNEPSLWNVTHRDVHPEPLGYDELLARTIEYASAIREADPEGLIAGPAEWGWLGYQSSAVDREAGQSYPDREAHGGKLLVAWYLQKLAEHEKSTGKRLLDILDLHFYPAADGVFEGGKVDAAAADLRLRSTRALWDPTYEDESWIKDKIRLIPRMAEWVRDNYPGRKLMIGEWSFGAESHISGGLAAAEALGRFGQQGLFAGFFWGELKSDTPAFWAFRAFRDFDGKGARFLELSVPVEETADVSLFASRDGSSEHMVLVLVNHRFTAKSAAEITLQGCGRVTSARAFAYQAGSKALAPGAVTATGSGVSAALEPASFAVLDLRLGK